MKRVDKRDRSVTLVFIVMSILCGDMRNAPSVMPYQAYGLDKKKNLN